MNSKKPLHKIAVASTSFTTEAYLDGRGASPSIRFGYEDEKDGYECQTGLKFTRVAAIRKRAERCCKSWHIEGAYDTLVEIENSEWVKEIRADTLEQWQNKWAMNHYMIYFDSTGCFELIAESWTVIPTEVVPFPAQAPGRR